MGYQQQTLGRIFDIFNMNSQNLSRILRFFPKKIIWLWKKRVTREFKYSYHDLDFIVLLNGVPSIGRKKNAEETTAKNVEKRNIERNIKMENERKLIN